MLPYVPTRPLLVLHACRGPEDGTEEGLWRWGAASIRGTLGIFTGRDAVLLLGPLGAKGSFLGHPSPPEGPLPLGATFGPLCVAQELGDSLTDNPWETTSPGLCYRPRLYRRAGSSSFWSLEDLYPTQSLLDASPEPHSI